LRCDRAAAPEPNVGVSGWRKAGLLP